MNTPDQSPLGKSSAYQSQYAPELLFPIPRQQKREELGLSGTLPFFGVDIWNAYELSWLNMRGKPQVAIATVTAPADSPNIVESKSFKLYLNSFNQTRLAGPEALLALLRDDLSNGFGAPVHVTLTHPEQFGKIGMGELEGTLLDRLDSLCSFAGPAAAQGQSRGSAGRGNPGVAPAQVQLPGHRPAGLGHGADPLRRPADRPGRLAEIPDRLPRAQ